MMNRMPVKFRIELSPYELATLRYCAEQRHTSTALLVEQIVKTALRERLVSAVLDDEYPAPPPLRGRVP
jgi:hypothetical protein